MNNEKELQKFFNRIVHKEHLDVKYTKMSEQQLNDVGVTGVW